MPFYGERVDELFVNINGAVSFADPGDAWIDFLPIPSESAPNGTIYVYGDYLYFREGSTVRTQARGVAPNREFLIEWHNMYDYHGGQLSAEVILAENGTITLNYDGLDPENSGADALVGRRGRRGTWRPRCSTTSLSCRTAWRRYCCPRRTRCPLSCVRSTASARWTSPATAASPR